MDFYVANVKQLAKMLRNVGGWLDKAEAHAKERSYDPSVLLTARLAPDQWHLSRQITAACDAAKFAASRGAAKDAPKHADDEPSFAALRTRTAAVAEYLESFGSKDFDGIDERVVTPAALQGKALSGWDYLFEFAVPNAYFHLTTAYAILRHNGVPLGKLDYVGALNLRDP